MVFSNIQLKEYSILRKNKRNKVEYIERFMFLLALLSEIYELDFIMDRLLTLLSIMSHDSQTPALKLTFQFIANRRNNLLF